MDWFKRLVNWPFLNEPFWRWVVFVIALGIALGLWNRVIKALS